MKKILLALLLFSFTNAFAQRNKSKKKSNKPYYVVTLDSLPFLNYGLGEDRLGGAKMTFLDSNIILKVVDSVGEDYKVQLSQLHSAYIGKKNVKRINPIPEMQHLTGSWSAQGDSLYDYVSVSLDQKLPYKSVMQINPSRIVVDIFGATSNTNWITQLSSLREVKNVWYEQVEDDVMRIFIELKHPQHWGYKIYYVGKSLTIRVKPQPERLQLKNLVIAIDAGHGGSNLGTDGVTTTLMEKDLTLMISKELVSQLEKKNVKVIQTREQDTTLSMYERITYLNQQNPDLLISIHLNSSSKEAIQGVSTYYRYVAFRPLSQFILKSMLNLGLHEFGNVGSFNFSLNGPTEFPNCLVEVAFLSNREDEQKVLDPLFRKQVAGRIIEGIENFLEFVGK